MENWLSIAAGVYLLAMVLYGHYRGFIRLAVSMVALVAALAIVHVSAPKVTQYLKENTSIQQSLAENMKKAAGMERLEALTESEVSELFGQTGQPSAQRMVIEGLELPESIKFALIENNNTEVYQMLGVSAFADYVGSYLADIILNSIGFVLLFFLVYLGIRLIMRWLDILAKLPILSGINKIAGALLGGVQGLVFLWLLCLLLTACSGTAWGMSAIRQIEATPWLAYIYDHNFLNILALGVLKGML